MDEGSGYCSSAGEIESVSDAAKICEYGNDRHWRRRKGIDYFRGLLREIDKNEFSFRGIESKIVRRHPR